MRVLDFHESLEKKLRFKLAEHVKFNYFVIEVVLHPRTNHGPEDLDVYIFVDILLELVVVFQNVRSLVSTDNSHFIISLKSWV